jgi:hypothetical protein
MIELRPIKLHWLVGENGDDTGDLCAHGTVYLKIGSRLVSDEESGDWTVSAASYYLLKALSNGHDGTKEPQLLPCCGMPLPAGDMDTGPVLVGCPNGINWTITNEGERTLHLFGNNELIEVERNKWQKAVCQFSLEVRQFFTDSNPKKPFDLAEGRGLELFMQDWNALIEQYC